jgi:hypothetical protein
VSPQPKAATLKADGTKAKRGADGPAEVVVDTIATGEVTVTPRWYCSAGVRTFTPEDMRETVEQIDLVASYGMDCWLRRRDSHGAEFYVGMREGRAYLSNVPADDDAGHVAWSTFKRALVARSKS